MRWTLALLLVSLCCGLAGCDKPEKGPDAGKVPVAEGPPAVPDAGGKGGAEQPAPEVKAEEKKEVPVVEEKKEAQVGGAVEGKGGEEEEEEYYDPTPVESPAAPAAEKPAEAEKPRVSQVIPFPAGLDPFGALKAPVAAVLPESSPLTDTIRVGYRVPPEKGEVQAPFPPRRAVPPKVEPVIPELAVVRHGPDGKVDVAGAVTASFNQAMVPLAALSTLDAMTAPLKLEPMPEGRFLWMGTDTVVFTPKDRMPFATRYTATVPAGAKSAVGKALGVPFSWSFETPRPRVVESVPSDGASEVEPDTTLALTFNAAVDPETALKSVQLKESGVKLIELELAPLPEPKRPTGNPTVDAEAERYRQRTVVFKPVDRLRAGTVYNVVVLKELTCKEGPLPAGESRVFSFSTYYPLAVHKIACSWDDSPCYPGAPVGVEFNNTLKRMNVDGLVEVTPKVEEMSLQVHGNTVYVAGDFQPATEYEVKVKPGFVDVHGQTSAKGMTKKVKYGDVNPYMTLQRTGLVVLEAAESHDLTLTAANVTSAKLRMARISAGQVFDAVERAHKWWNDQEDPMAGLKLKVDRTFPVNKEKNRIERQQLLLEEGLEEGRGIVLLDLNPVKPVLATDWYVYRQMALVQVTDVGLTAAMSLDECHVLVSRLSDASPLAGAQVGLYVKGSDSAVAKGTTDANGLVKLPGPEVMDKQGPYLLMAKAGADEAFLVLDGHVTKGAWLSSWGYYPSKDREERMTGMVFAERGLYRPGEEVFLTVIARRSEKGPAGDLSLMRDPSWSKLNYSVQDPRGTELAKGLVEIDARFQTGSLKVALPKDAALGYYHVHVGGVGGTLYGGFQVEEYRTPEFKVGVEFVTGGTNVLVWRKLSALVTGTYYFGASMAGASVQWRLVREAGSYTPPGNQEFSFQDIDPKAQTSPWARWGWYDDGDWGYRGRHRGGRRGHYNYHSRGMETEVATGSGTLDGNGNLNVPVALTPGEIRRQPVTFTLEAEVIDANRQSIAGRATLVAHRAERYVGISLDRTVMMPGDPVTVSGVVTRLDGSRYASADVTVKLMQASWKNVEDMDESGNVFYRWDYAETEAGTCVFTAGRDPGKCTLTPKKGGTYVVRAETKDLKGRPARSALWLNVVGEEETYFRPDQQEHRVTLVADRPEYLPGEKARVLVQSPFAGGRGLLMVSREGFAKVEPITVEKGSALVEVPLDDAWIPGIEVSVALVRGRVDKPGVTKDDRGRPAFAYGHTRLTVLTKKRALTLGIEPSSLTYEPGGAVSIGLSAKNMAGEPVKARLAVMVVDEGVLSLIAYRTPDPLAALYTGKPSQTGVLDVRPMVAARVKPEPGAGGEKDNMEEEGRATGGVARKAKGAMMPSEAMPAAAPMQGLMEKSAEGPGGLRDESGEAAGPAFELRQLFKSTAYFNAAVDTDLDGRAKVEFTLPDNLTEYRVMVVAADDGVKFGSADKQIRTQRPVVVRPALPRFLNLGDSFEAAAVVNNQSGYDTEVMVRCLAANATVEGAAVQQVAVKDGEAAEVRFKAASAAPGPATFQFAVVALTQRRPTDAAEVTIPVLIPATSEAFATYGVTEKAAVQPIVPPEDALPGYGGLEVSMSSTALTGLQDAVKYLFDYPYECTEQICSRLLPILALGDILADFKLGKAETPEEAKKLVESGLKELLTHQREDGGFGYWPDSKMSWMYISAYALMTLDYAKKKGFEVPQGAMERAMAFLQSRLDNPYEWEKWEYSSQVMAALALTRLGKAPTAHLERLYSHAVTKAGKQPGSAYVLPLFAKAWLLEALWLSNHGDARVEELYRHINNAAVETASAIHFTEDVTEGLQLMMHSDDRTDSIVLYALLATRPADPLIEKVVRGLVRSRVDGRWATTQSNAYALMALSEYYRVFEKETPDFTAFVWQGTKALVSYPFKGRTMTIAKSRVPTAELLSAAARELVIGKEGKGRLYYRLGLKYARKAAKIEADDRGFGVERVYLPEVDGGDNLKRREDGTYEVKAGTYIRVKLRVVSPDRRFYVAVVDPMPAGFEAVNEAFVTSATTRLGGGASSEEYYTGGNPFWWWHWNPWDHEERRDDRVQLFMDWMHGGVYEYTYYVRATTIGTFVVPPTRAEEMYEPETFGRAASETVVVVP